jgi:hypothetical protein
MGSSQGKTRSNDDTTVEERTYYDLTIVPTKAVFTPATEDISG